MRALCVLQVDEYSLKERFEIKYSWCRQTGIRYHIYLMCVLIILLSIRYNVCACYSPVYHYITATAVYLIQRFITACVVVM